MIWKNNQRGVKMTTKTKPKTVKVLFAEKDVHIYDKLDKDSRALGMDKSSYIRMLIAKGLK